MSDRERLEILRDNLGSIRLDNVPLFEDLEEDEKLELYAHAHQVYNSKFFKILVKTLVKTQLEYAVQMSKSWDQDLFARATINGMNLVSEAYENYDKLYESSSQPKDNKPTDPHQSFEQTKV